MPLAAALNRVIARDVPAPIDLPPFDNSAVDGYAVRHADLAAEGDTRLRIVDRLTAGSASTRALNPGEADSHLHRCADAGGRRHRVHAGGYPRGGRHRDRAAGTEARRQQPRRRRGLARRSDHVPGRTPAHRLACRACGRGRAHDRCRCAGACGLLCSRPATRSSSLGRRCRRRGCSMPTAICSRA